MAKLNAMLEALAETAREEWPETLFSDVTAARDEDDSVFHAKIEALEAGNAELTSQVSSLKNELYDMGKLIPVDDAIEDAIEDDSDEDEDHDPIDDFFEEVE